MPGPDLTTTLDALFPANVATVLSLSPDDPVELGPRETAAAANFVPKRLAEFRHGRACVRRALMRLGATASDIPVGPAREPLWPVGIVGSITHDGNRAAAAVARATNFAALGLDLEPATPLEPALIPRICLPAEVECTALAAGDPGQAAKMIFCIKEAAYKALWPELRLVLDFHELEILLEAGSSEFRVISRSGRCPAGLAARIAGRYLCLQDFFVAGAALPAR